MLAWILAISHSERRKRQLHKYGHGQVARGALCPAIEEGIAARHVLGLNLGLGINVLATTENVGGNDDARPGGLA